MDPFSLDHIFPHRGIPAACPAPAHTGVYAKRRVVPHHHPQAGSTTVLSCALFFRCQWTNSNAPSSTTVPHEGSPPRASGSAFFFFFPSLELSKTSRSGSRRSPAAAFRADVLGGFRGARLLRHGCP